ncbi:facilitated trehalose transporter Tret1-like [Ceratina calcarata]|uniref:Facilitated trehalose transporter Tret1-like n=1 Tax=Ceratina calcarata TaxID=156304 RepID=A0AAJ7JHN2_9HYME|nr:facilitated trehalose transporter Tret1-like [Ceratina calcarata]
MSKKDDAFEPGKLRQFLISLIANLSSLSFGIMISWPSSTLPQLQGKDSPINGGPMTDEAASWLTGIMCLTAAATSSMVGFSANMLGRKLTACLMGLPLCLCWLFTIFATEQWHLFVARFFSGISGGMVLFLIPMYVSEIASDGIRGMLGSLMVFLLNGGVLLGYILGALLSYRVCAIVAFLFPLFYIALFVFVPESPVHLVRRNRINEATKSLMWLRGSHRPTVEQALSHLQTEAKEQNITGRTIKLSDLFRDRATIKGLVITLGLFSSQQLSGINAVMSYTQSIFETSGSSLSPNNSAIIVGFIQLCGSFLSTTLMERAGRRSLMLTSCFMMSTCHCILGVFGYLRTLGHDVSQFSWISIVALSFYMIAYSLGMGPGPYVVSSEILSRDISNLMMTIAMCYMWLMAFLVVKLFPSIVDAIGMHGCFFLLGGFCAATLLFIFILVPETKGEPRQVILDRLNGISRPLAEKLYISSSNVIEKRAESPELV